MNNIDKLKSTCCKAEVEIRNFNDGTYRWHCAACNQGCDTWFPKQKMPKTIEKHTVERIEKKTRSTGKDWINEWKDNFCKHISDWSYISAEAELDTFIQKLLDNQQEQFKGNTKRIAYSQGYDESITTYKKDLISKLDSMKWVSPSAHGQFSQHADGYNQGLEEAIEVIKQ